MRRSARLLPLLVPLLVAGKCKDKKVVDEDDIVGVDDANSPDVRLQVISLDPDEVPPSKGFDATVYGSNFQDGARVILGGAPIQTVRYQGENALQLTVPPLTAGEYDVEVHNPDGESATLHGGLWVNPDYRDPNADLTACSNLTLPFEYDASGLTPGARQVLDDMSACITSLGVPVRIEGHCDERGTTEYNLALGQRRADTVRSYLVAKGVPPSRLRTISYGEERPAVSGTGESVYAANRRVEIIAER